MNYEGFRRAWHEALDAAGIQPFPVTETIDLGRMSRIYRATAHLGSAQQARPFCVTAALSWTWDALQSARTETVEEDLLMELLGDERRGLDTELPWLRVDVTLRATLPLDSPLPLPKTATWRRWVADVTARLEPLLPVEFGDGDDELPVLAWRDEPQAGLHCAPDGHLYLSRVELPAWQGIYLPRQRDDIERIWDDGWNHQQLDHFAGRVAGALRAWEDSLRHLLPTATSAGEA